jgi:hypothetical protein
MGVGSLSFRRIHPRLFRSVERREKFGQSQSYEMNLIDLFLSRRVSLIGSLDHGDRSLRCSLHSSDPRRDPAGFIGRYSVLSSTRYAVTEEFLGKTSALAMQ